MASSRSTRTRRTRARRRARCGSPADKFITADDILVSVIRVHNPTDRVQTIYVDPIIRPEETFAYEWVGSVSGLVTLEDGEVSGREPRFLSLDGRQELHGEPVDCRFRYAVVDDPPRTLKVGAERSARASPVRRLRRSR